jgi:hypothetical protein
MKFLIHLPPNKKIITVESDIDLSIPKTIISYGGDGYEVFGRRVILPDQSESVCVKEIHVYADYL